MRCVNNKELNKEIVYLYYLTESVNEGGMARNKAFYETFNDLGASMYNIYTKHTLVRFWISFKALVLLFFVRNKTVFIHQGALLFVFSMVLLRIKFFRKNVFCLLNIVSKNNKLIIEINDLIYEQSIDLEFKVDEIFLILQKNIFGINDCNFVFASNEMESYVVSKYSIQSKKSSVILNGAPKVNDCSTMIKNENWMECNKNKFVYAGSLNKGRQIEDLLNVFKGEDDSLLIILGSNGEWLNDLELPTNILYLGNFEEEEAHYLVSKCDIGLIPYSADRFYYNMCFPTKVSFYITAGLPILSTPLKELQQVFKNENIFFFRALEEWKFLIQGLSKMELLKMKESVEVVKKEYHWNTLLKKIEGIIY